MKYFYLGILIYEYINSNNINQKLEQKINFYVPFIIIIFFYFIPLVPTNTSLNFTTQVSPLVPPIYLYLLITRYPLRLRIPVNYRKTN